MPGASAMAVQPAHSINYREMMRDIREIMDGCRGILGPGTTLSVPPPTVQARSAARRRVEPWTLSSCVFELS